VKITGIQRLVFLGIVVFLSLVFSSGCSREEEYSLYRFIDHLEDRNVLKSPLKDLVTGSQHLKANSSLLEIVDRFNLEDSGTGENSYKIKKLPCKVR